MNSMQRRTRVIVAGLGILCGNCVLAADWSQWRGANRDGKSSDFKAPETWPKELKQQWKATVGAGDATPAVVGDKIFVFARQGSDEITLCLDASSGKSIWQDKYPAPEVSGPAGAHPGPRSSPAVAEGKVVTFGVAGVLSCLDAESGKVVWRKESAKDFQSPYPNFFTASSPLLADGLCVAHLGGRGSGAIVAYDLKTGEQKWKSDGQGPAYASPVLMTVDGAKQVVDLGEKSLVGLNLEDGKPLWEVATSAGGGGGMGRGGPGGPGPGGPGGGGPGGPGGPRGRGGPGGRGMSRSYNACTPMVEGTTVILPGQGMHAYAIEKQDGKYVAKELWTNASVSTSFNSPVLKDEMIFGLSGANSIFCLDAKTGKQLWANESPAGGGGGRGPGGFGSIVDAGPVLMALSPAGDLIVFKPDATQYAPLATLKVASTPTYAYPVVGASQILIKDQDSVAMFVLDQ